MEFAGGPVWGRGPRCEFRLGAPTEFLIIEWEIAMSERFSYRELIHEAGRLEGDGELEAALDLIREALARDDDPHVVTTLGEHLRYPHLLQRTGHVEEARQAFERLLEEGYPGQLTNVSVQWIERGMIYNAMRRAFGREGLHTEAALYEGLSHLAEAYGHFLEGDRNGSVDPALSRNRVEAVAADMCARVDGAVSRREVVALLNGVVEQFGRGVGERLLRETETELRRLFGVDS